VHALTQSKCHAPGKSFVLLFVLLMAAVTVELLMQELIKTLLIQQSEKVNENESDD